jgi:hypothetical protein
LKKEKVMRVCILGAACLLALAFAPAAMYAQERLLGKEAPPFHARNIVNPDGTETLDQVASEVVLIKYWGLQ